MIYTIQELIEALKDLPPHAAVHVWDNGDRRDIESVDVIDDTTVDLNITDIDLRMRLEVEDEINQLREQLHEMRITMGFIQKLSKDV